MGGIFFFFGHTVREPPETASASASPFGLKQITSAHSAAALGVSYRTVTRQKGRPRGNDEVGVVLAPRLPPSLLASSLRYATEVLPRSLPPAVANDDVRPSFVLLW